MARGKHGRSAALRRESAEITTTIEDYKRAVVKLTQERDSLSEKLDREKLEGLAETTKLRRMVAAGVSPELAARDRVIEQLRGDLGRSRSAHKELQINHDRCMDIIFAMLSEAGMGVEESFEWMLKHVTMDDSGKSWEGTVIPGHVKTSVGETLGPEGVRRIRQARGLGRSPGRNPVRAAASMRTGRTLDEDGRVTPDRPDLKP